MGGNLSTGVTSGGTITANQNFANGTGGSNIRVQALGSGQGQLAGYSLYSTFVGTGDNGPRRSADIWSGYNAGNWGTEFLAFGVGNNGAANDAANITIERLRITGSGNIVQAAGLYYDTISGAITAAGTVQGDATALSTSVNNVTTVAASTGVRLPAPIQAGARILIRNSGANILRIYPQTSAQINTLGTNVALQLEQGALIEFVAFTTTQWFTVNATFA